MRVTSTTMHQTVLNSLQTSLGRVATTQAELASGRRINIYSDAPADASAAIRLRAEEADWTSYGKAADDGQVWLNTQDQALQDMSRLLRRVRELTVSAATSINDTAAREGIALEIEGIRDELAGLANSSYQGQSVFGGYASKAVTPVAGNWTWTGDSGTVSRRVSPDMVVQVNGDGRSILGFGAGQTDVFTALNIVASHVRAGDVAALSNNDLDMIDTNAGYVTNGLAAVGARGNVVEAAKNTGWSQIAVLKDQRSTIEDVDVAETALRMQLAQNGYQAALSAAARLSMPSLVDFLR